MNYLHNCSYGPPYLLGFCESIRLSYFCATPNRKAMGVKQHDANGQAAG